MLRVLYETDISTLLHIEELTQAVPWTEETFSHCMKAGYVGWVIELEGRVVGFIIVSMHTGESHILNLGVHPEYQRRGFGRELLEQALSVAKAKEVGIAYLEVRRSNAKAIALYEKAGFVQVGERKSYYPGPLGREDALIFAKDLAV
jgi:ribosomal-protein-alanine N-acetyltransferase